MAHAHCMLIPKAANTLSEYGTLIAFPQQQWLHERASMLRCTYTVYLVQMLHYTHIQVLIFC